MALIFDAVVIGSGQAGGPLAKALVAAGRKTALVERVHIGGCCVNEGCTPTKTMIASGRVAYLAKRAGADYGVHVPGSRDGQVVVDMLKVRERKRAIVDRFRTGNETRLRGAGVHLLMGEASFAVGSPPSLIVKLATGGKQIIEAGQYFINVGERPILPKLEGIEAIPNVLDSTTIMELDTIPEHLLVLGGGYIGIEFAQLFRRLGSQVSIVQRRSQLLPREDPEIAAEVTKILKEDGVSVHLDSEAVSVRSRGNSAAPTIDLQIRTGGATKTLSGSHILAAVGRAPNSDLLNLSGIGLKTNNHGYIETNEFLETSVPNIWSLGDVNGPPAFTHISYDDYRIVSHNVLHPEKLRKSRQDRLVPYTVFMDPQLGHVGLHEHECRALGLDIKVASMPMTYVARALETDETRGMMKAVVDKGTGKILGFTCLGIEGGEVMNVVQVAMMGGLPYTALEDAVWAHPTLGEALNNLWAFLN